jgi:hypothetical protein
MKGLQLLPMVNSCGTSCHAGKLTKHPTHAWLDATILFSGDQFYRAAAISQVLLIELIREYRYSFA